MGQAGGDAGGQLPEAKGFDDTVLLGDLDLVVLPLVRGMIGEEEDGTGHVATDLFAQFQPTGARRVNVQQDQVGFVA